MTHLLNEKDLFRISVPNQNQSSYSQQYSQDEVNYHSAPTVKDIHLPILKRTMTGNNNPHNTSIDIYAVYRNQQDIISSVIKLWEYIQAIKQELDERKTIEVDQQWKLQLERDLNDLRQQQVLLALKQPDTCFTC